MSDLVRVGPDGAFKLRPVRERFELWDGYRGDLRITWVLNGGHEAFGTACIGCGQAWGWTPDLGQARRVWRAMKKHGCPRCMKGRLK